MTFNYWEEAFVAALDEIGVECPDKEKVAIAGRCLEGSHENYGMSIGRPGSLVDIGSSEIEILKLTKALDRERSKIVCPECCGRRVQITHGPCHSAMSQCWKCGGDGKADP